MAELPIIRRRQWLLTRDFSLVWWSQVLSQVADGVSKLALLWFVYSITGSPLKTTVIGLLQTLPPILLGPIIGVTVDRLPKKAILIISDLARALLIGLIPCWVSVESFTVESLYVMTFLYGIATAMFVPTLSSSVPLMVKRSQLTAANALLQGTTSLGIIIGPAISGLGIAMSGSQDVLCVNAITYVASAVFLFPLRLSSGMTKPLVQPQQSTAIQDLIEGIRYTLVSRRAILLLIILASLYTFGSGAFTTLFPVFGKKLLSLGPVEVGYLWSWLGVGLLMVSLSLVRLTAWDLPSRISVITLSSAVGGLALFGLIWVSDIVVATILIVLVGIGFGTWTPIAWGIIQELSPAHMIGRVMALYTAIATATSMAGMTFFGWLMEVSSEAVSLVGIGMVLLVLAASTAWFRHRVAQERPAPV
ncbi:MAG TPA: MFS transporter [Nitrospiraceae bacterium]|nr:MFS transporter [Nitrospiraceae bacterium]